MMNNLKNFGLVAFLLLTSTIYAQRTPDRERIKSLKIAFITERLDLSNDEAEAFWPVYNAHEKRLEGFRRTERLEFRGKLLELDAISDTEAAELLEKYIALENEKSDEQLNFYKKVKEILSAKKTMLLMKAEEDFKRRLIQQYRKRRSGG